MRGDRNRNVYNVLIMKLEWKDSSWRHSHREETNE